VLARAAVGSVAVLGLCLAELLAVAIARPGRIASVWELQFGLVYLAPTLAGIAVFFGLVGAGWTALLDKAETRAAPRLALAVAALAFAFPVVWGIGGGRHLASTSLRGGFAAGVALAAALFTFALAPRLARWWKARPLGFAAGLLAVVFLLELANRFVLVRLYPAFHLGLALLALLAMPAALLCSIRPAESRALAAAWLGAGALAGVTLAPASGRLARFDNFRLLLLDEAPVLAQAVRLAARIAPPPPIPEDCSDCGPAEAEAPPARSLGLAGRDILLVTIDALRADHVGAWGYARQTTPNIDRLAADSALFTHAYCATPHTSYSIGSLMTGKYLRPLLLQGAGQDSDTWASLLRTYGYRTAAFFPPAIFFIDAPRFAGFQARGWDFEYKKVEFLEGEGRVKQVAGWLEAQPAEQRLFAWVHLFGPHEPYEAHPEHPFGSRDIDRYDSEIAAADVTAGKLVELFRARRPGAIVILTADHGEEFGEHGGRYHGTTVYEEQVRVPMLISAPGAIPPGRHAEPVQTIDLLPTLLAALDVPRPPRLRGRDLGPLVAGSRPSGAGIALAETEEQVLLAEGAHRLICERKLGACRLYDLARDAGQQAPASGDASPRGRELRGRLRELAASHGRYERSGLRAEGKGWPPAILRGISGEGDAAEEIASLLDDADRAIRRKAAELLFRLKRRETAPALRLALGREEDVETRRWVALALTRLEQGAPLVYELERSEDLRWSRLAALALAEAGDARGQATLVKWWGEGAASDFDLARELLDAFAKIRSKQAVWTLAQSLGDVRLRPHIARTLAAIGDPAARLPLARALRDERYQTARVAIASALVDLGAEAELAAPLVRFLGVPDPLPGGLAFASRARVLAQIGGPDPRALARLKRDSALGAALTLVVPAGGNGKGIRVLVRGRSPRSPGGVFVGARLSLLRYDRKGMPQTVRDLPRIDPARRVRIELPASEAAVDAHALLPAEVGARPGRPIEVVVFADRQVEIEELALVPLADELPPPAPEPWLPPPPG
jgi:hypothetical protein